MEVNNKAVVELRVLKMPPVPLEGVRRSARRAPPPKRFQFSPETAHVKSRKQKRRRTTTTHNNQTSQNVGDSDEKDSPVGYGRYSAYELERLENIRQNQVFLSSINLLQSLKKPPGPLAMDPLNMEEGLHVFTD
ncbi:uncharacterized protein PEZ65_018688 isoform 2-T2 [Lycodopsis pacificus]